MGELRQALNAEIRRQARQRVLARLSETERAALESAAAAVQAGQTLTAQQAQAFTAHLQAVDTEVGALIVQLTRTAGRQA
jgi:hypothetical protein